MSKKSGSQVSDDQIRQYIRNLATKRGEGSDVSVEHLRKKWSIGYKRAKRLHDDELGPTEHPAPRTAAKTQSKSTATRDSSSASEMSDEHVIAFIQRCRAQGRDISTNELRHELHIGYKRAVRLLTQGSTGVRPTHSPRKRPSTALNALIEGADVGAQEDENEHHHSSSGYFGYQSASKKPRRPRRQASEGSDAEDDYGELDEASKGLEGETLDEGRVEPSGDGLLEFTDVVLKDGGWEETLHSYEYKDK